MQLDALDGIAAQAFDGFIVRKDLVRRFKESLSPRTRDVMLLRMVPFVENNYNAVELGPRGTGKSHLYQQVSPYAHLVSGGQGVGRADVR